MGSGDSPKARYVTRRPTPGRRGRPSAGRGSRAVTPVTPPKALARHPGAAGAIVPRALTVATWRALQELEVAITPSGRRITAGELVMDYLLAHQRPNLQTIRRRLTAEAQAMQAARLSPGLTIPPALKAPKGES